MNLGFALDNVFGLECISNSEEQNPRKVPERALYVSVAEDYR